MESLLNLLLREQDIANTYNKNVEKSKIIKEELAKLKLEYAAIPKEELKMRIEQKESEVSNLHFINCSLLREVDSVRKTMTIYMPEMRDHLLD